MNKIDDAEEMRIRAHRIWEREGKPLGREHEHWAEAAREREGELASDRGARQETPDMPYDTEIVRLRRALYEPGVFSVELFGQESVASSDRGGSDRNKRSIISDRSAPRREDRQAVRSAS